MDELRSRLDRLESLDAIRQLCSHYGMLVDRRDLDNLVELFVPDVRVTRTERGRPALRAFLDGLLRQFTTSFHFIGNHTIDFIDRDHAEGVVYCKAEHEYGEEWIVMDVEYSDRYERREGRWFFTGRKERHWYAVDWLDRPTGDDKTRWPVTGQHTLPHLYPSWNAYWEESHE